MRGLIAGLALAVLGAAGAGAQERTVNVYNWSDYIDPKTVPGFQAETGIKVVYDVYDSNEILEAKLLTGRSGYDVVVPTNSPFFVRQLAAGVYQSLDRDKIKNWDKLDPRIMELLAKYDPQNAYSIPWMWGTSGIGYNVQKVRAVMPDAPLDSLALLMDPAIVSRFAKCGVMMLDSPTDVISAALKYLGRDPDSKSKEDLDAAAAHLQKVRPHVRKFHSSEYINALANGDICIAFGFSGDVIQAMNRAREAKRGVEISYSIPKEGALFAVDVLAIPSSAKNVDEAHAFIDYLMRPEVSAQASSFIGYASGNKAALPMVAAAVRDDPRVYPPQAVVDRFYTLTPGDAAYERLRTRAWTRVKTGR
ncbi:putrescine transport system substrate-binding protein [Stella humosa]|uniref:Putrescine-binding periplasmic protein n=1 Tax=Stella humosa TaxID=94 RepID=A0A3N1KWB7_9PROT|nr:polyamine ABC transporter substrate-binding protein [Stella humosa]ROP83722.1 putrescine transport system substrate-binding protein [Stella humosa]BBK33006.1 putrescine-binding periplasmic protein [Stella humosa]